ncbi:MAG: Gfo/Idh/MocA family oxidoreductase [Bryobacteraceae bacterium]|nr:Gfo/Idh/MocA family oxidoreductase [Bryobacteraceae bacterium]
MRGRQDQRGITRRGWLSGSVAALWAQAAPQAVRLPRRVRVAIVGFDGHYGEILGPLPRLPDVEIVAICDRDGAVLERMARRPALAHARRYTELERMLDAERLDLVAVCNNNGERAAAILACAARKLHVIAEKPLAIERDSLRRVQEAIARNGVELSMLLPMRFAPPYLAMKRIVDSGEIGEVAQIGAQKSYKVGQRPEWMKRRATFGGTIPWIGIHMVDLMRWASGREFVEAVSFQARVGFPELGEMENTTATLFRLDNDGVAVLRMDYLRPETAPTHGDDRLRLAGTKGIVEYQPATGVTVMSATRKPEVVRDLPPPGSVFVDFLEAVYAGKPRQLTLADIFRVNEIVLTAREAAEKRAVLAL